MGNITRMPPINFNHRISDFTNYKVNEIKLDVKRCITEGKHETFVFLFWAPALTPYLITALREQEYRVEQKETHLRISWTSLRTHDLWRVVFTHFIIRRALKRHVRRRIAEWIIPPNGRLYLNAKERFKIIQS